MAVILGGPGIYLGGASAPPVPSFVNEYSMTFNGISDYIDLGTASNLEMTDDFSISVWIKDSSVLNRGIICCGDRSSTSGWMIYRNSSNKAVFSLYTVNNKNATSTTSINTGTWTNIIATFEKNGTASQQIKIYINGVLEGQGGWLSTQTPTYGGTIYKQIAFPYAGTNEFEGLIDEASIYNRLLTSQEISEISATPIDLSSYSPLSWWRMGDGDTFSNPGGIGDWTLIDNGSGGNDGTSVSMPEEARLPISPNSYSQNSFVFDGTDFVTLGNSSNLNVTGDQSVSCWVKFSVVAGSSYVINVKDIFGVYTSSGKIQGFSRINGNFNNLPSASTYNDNQWHHVVFLKDANDLTLYIDGAFESELLTAGGTSLGTTNDARLGNRYTNASYYTGASDEIAIFDYKLTPAQITQIFNNGVPTDISSLNPLGHWRMGENATWDGANWTFVDQGSGGNDGTSSTFPEEAKTGDQPYVL